MTTSPIGRRSLNSFIRRDNCQRQPMPSSVLLPILAARCLLYTAIIVGYHENVLLIGQLILIFCSLYSFFAIIRDPKRKLAFALIFTSMAVFNYFNIAIRMNNLLVDFILPVLTLAGIAGLFALKGNVLPSIGFFLLIGASLDLVKNSAVFSADFRRLFTSLLVADISSLAATAGHDDCKG